MFREIPSIPGFPGLWPPCDSEWKTDESYLVCELWRAHHLDDVESRPAHIIAQHLQLNTQNTSVSNKDNKAVLSQGNCAMPQLLVSVKVG